MYFPFLKFKMKLYRIYLQNVYTYALNYLYLWLMSIMQINNYFRQFCREFWRN